MTPEEAQVYESLAPHYCFDLEQVGLCEVTPTNVLYEYYLKHLRESFADPGSALNPTQFGVALRRVFDVDPDRRVRLRIEGKREWGYRHVRGPHSVRMNENRGNPNFRRQREPVLLATR